jgi:hypothetical protein
MFNTCSSPTKIDQLWAKFGNFTAVYCQQCWWKCIAMAVNFHDAVGDMEKLPGRGFISELLLI